MTAPFAIRTTPDQKTCPKGAFHKCRLPTDRFSRNLPHDGRPRNGSYVPKPNIIQTKGARSPEPLPLLSYNPISRRCGSGKPVRTQARGRHRPAFPNARGAGRGRRDRLPGHRHRRDAGRGHDRRHGAGRVHGHHEDGSPPSRGSRGGRVSGSSSPVS